MPHVLKHSANWFSNNCTSQMTNMHLFGNVWWWKINNYSLLWNFWEIQSSNKLIDFRFNELILNFYLQKSFFIRFNWTNNVIFKLIIYNFLSEFDNSFATKRCSLFFVFIHVELFHDIWRNILALVFGTILNDDFRFNCRESFLDNFFKCIFNKSWDKFSLCLHFKVD